MDQQYRPTPVGLYDPSYERDSCGFGLIADLDDRASRALVDARSPPCRAWPIAARSAPTA